MKIVIELLKEAFHKQIEEYKRKGLEAEVERRKKRAFDAEIDDIVGSLWNSVQYYPSWYEDKPVCSLVTAAKELEKVKDGGKEWRRIQITLKGKEYIFKFEERDTLLPDDTTERYGDLELYSNNEKILALSMARDLDTSGSEWRPFEIDAFIEGSWMKDFKEFKNVSEKESRESLDKMMRTPADKLKKDFGIK